MKIYVDRRTTDGSGRTRRAEAESELRFAVRGGRGILSLTTPKPFVFPTIRYEGKSIRRAENVHDEGMPVGSTRGSGRGLPPAAAPSRFVG